MPILNGITYEELEHSGRTTYSHENGWVGHRTFLVAWDDRRAFAEALLGYTDPIGGLGISFPGQRFPGHDFLFCRDIAIEDIGEQSQGAEMASYPNAKVTATYRPHKFGTSTSETDEFDEDAETSLAALTEEWDFSGEFLTVPEGAYCWSLDLELINEAVGIIIGNADIVLTSAEEPLLRRDRIADALGAVNSVTWYGFYPAHVMFLGAAARRTTTAAGVGAWEITYRFRARSESYNEMYRPGVGWSAIETTAHGDPPYRPYNFYNLFAG